ncbi:MULTISPECIES: LysE family translocator [unclassified Pseudomonas]|jgi:Putative threonine efflux protein|uniref:LysE family translocator n=1 Tax=unclassified Pseudomonas TaxID=196821 RepID=UPI00041FEC8E|nr:MULTISPECIES: LysE family translocator [unclassified Pseudomonas]SMF58484.1 Threonine/homoserine/homoserine lactone efflux protein [Pseudomonas sp. LAIL14HWK12:I11]SMR79765.1 Threonine/homoserine/homoserine lactone efflux protein [Pseudomonas sp. LAIL14HWK12:I10]SOD06481.1 Threonine/homoserine/homoserine lactone efflux protein [Pseudomonas sp. LAIL14HWK12:I8]
MTELIAVALFTILAVISPGADFAMVTRSSYAQGRKAGLAAAVGIALGVQVHVLYTVLGIAVIISQSPPLFLFIKVVGAGYLIYLGYKSLTNTTRIHLDGVGQDTGASLRAALRTGFLTNALNPKTMLFVISAYTQVVQPGSPLALDFAYGAFMSFAHWVWFSLVAVFFSSTALRKAMIERQVMMDRVIGLALIGLGLAVVMANVR